MPTQWAGWWRMVEAIFGHTSCDFLDTVEETQVGEFPLRPPLGIIRSCRTLGRWRGRSNAPVMNLNT